uniref:class I SAM-dependent DNA methyltransferase n=1 Tax=Herbidospora sakaeratensis TaxID=564415 RepID=UPI0007828081|nr:class I SAM-dependent methyltransferase [Herbidospora sakaeratensis]
MTTRSAEAALAAYESLAPVYDTMKAGNNTGNWAKLLDGVIREAGPPGVRLMDAACGTGKTTLALRDLGYKVAGFDLSPSMIAAALSRGPGVAFQVGDLLDPPPGLGRFDVVTCLDDALNYLLDPADLDRALTGLAGLLAPGGVLVFDLNTLHAYRGVGATTTVIMDTDTEYVVLTGTARPDHAPGERLTLDFATFSHDGDHWRRADSSHHQRHHPAADVRALLEKAGLTVARVYGFVDGSLFDELDEHAADKALFVAVRAAG